MNKIYLVRSQKVMLDSDLAELFEVETRRLNEQVKRNINRFPEDFMFKLSEKEFAYLKSQIAATGWGGRRSIPYVFTGHGVLMLSSVINSPSAIAMNIQIMRSFTSIRETPSYNFSMNLNIKDIKKEYQNQDKKFELIFNYLDELIEKND